MNKAILDVFYPEAGQKFDDGLCVICETPIHDKDFKDTISRKEYEITGLCQKCQDETYSDDI